MGNPRTILFINSDPSADGKARWEQEYRDMGEALKRAEHRADFELKNCWATTTRSLQRAFLENEPAIVHIAGKNDGKGIIFESPTGEPVAVNPAAIAGLMDLFADKIELVVLSGCYDESQASAISSVIPFVIGLDYRLPAAVRIESSVAMYDAMGAGRDIPFAAKLSRNAVSMAGGDHALFHLFEKGGETDISKGASAQQGKDEGKDHLPPPDFSDYAGHSHAYSCDRAPQTQEFSENFYSEGKFKFFAVHGADPQSHEGLFKRFYHWFLRDPNNPERSPQRTISLQQAPAPDAYKAGIRFKLLESLGLGNMMRQPENEQMTAISRHFAQKQVHTVAVEFKVRSSHWKPFTPDLIRWFITEYCQLSVEIPSSPEFFFFLSIIYEDKADHEIMLSEIRKLVTQFPRCNILTELFPVSKEDILNWMDEYITSNSIRKTALFKKYFPENKPTYNMEDVELRLETIINNEPSDKNLS
ncbi:MAG: hypothetical protein SF052_00060 [Bacteroidia bacterium]|nr:hypothetical protein [Bacteroidia bacterium]